MTNSRFIQRSIALQAIFAIQQNKSANKTEVIRALLEENQIKEKDPFIVELIDGVLDNHQELDDTIEKYLNSKWEIDRISAIDRNILELTIFQIKKMIDIPPKVAIDQGLELAKKYSEETSVKFINGVLANIVAP